MAELNENQTGICIGVKDSSSQFLKYLDKNQITLGSKIQVMVKEEFDLSLKIKVEDKTVTVSNIIANNLYVKII